MTKITSAELQESFGRYLTEAHNHPVIIINHGNDDLVLISAEEYARLRQLDQQAFYAHELDTEVLNESEYCQISVPRYTHGTVLSLR